MKAKFWRWLGAALVVILLCVGVYYALALLLVMGIK
jgi:hypothetical protein